MDTLPNIQRISSFEVHTRLGRKINIGESNSLLVKWMPIFTMYTLIHWCILTFNTKQNDIEPLHQQHYYATILNKSNLVPCKTLLYQLASHQALYLFNSQ